MGRSELEWVNRLTRKILYPQEKKTALHLAAEKGRLQVCEHLLELRADISALDNVSPL